jgi:uncharacterized protein (TIGR02452 family)
MLNVAKSFNPLEWLLKFKKASEIKTGFRELRAEIFQETVRVVTSGGYCLDNKFISINNGGALENTEFFESIPKLQEHSEIRQTRFSVIEADCLETAGLLINAGYNPCVLNMANRQNPGGAGAQEENIFRRSNIFISLYQYAFYATEYGIPKSDKNYPLNRETGGVYSAGIVVFRGSERNGYCYLNNPFQVSVVTVPAINRPELKIVKGQYRIVNNLIKPTKEKIRTIYCVSPENIIMILLC